MSARSKRALLLIALVFGGCLSAAPVTAACYDEAGEAYGISPLLLWAIAGVESSYNPRAVNRNTNGSYDYGLMQINSLWYGVIGPKAWNMLSDSCYNVHVGAWVLSQCIQRLGYTWEAVGCYNSGNPDRRKAYAGKVRRQLESAGYDGRKHAPKIP